MVVKALLNTILHTLKSVFFRLLETKEIKTNADSSQPQYTDLWKDLTLPFSH